jgi:hypothetical protein
VFQHTKTIYRTGGGETEEMRLSEANFQLENQKVSEFQADGRFKRPCRTLNQANLIGYKAEKQIFGRMRAMGDCLLELVLLLEPRMFRPPRINQIWNYSRNNTKSQFTLNFIMRNDQKFLGKSV